MPTEPHDQGPPNDRQPPNHEPPALNIDKHVANTQSAYFYMLIVTSLTLIMALLPSPVEKYNDAIKEIQVLSAALEQASHHVTPTDQKQPGCVTFSFGDSGPPSNSSQAANGKPNIKTKEYTGNVKIAPTLLQPSGAAKKPFEDEVKCLKTHINKEFKAFLSKPRPEHFCDDLQKYAKRSLSSDEETDCVKECERCLDKLQKSVQEAEQRKRCLDLFYALASRTAQKPTDTGVEKGVRTKEASADGIVSSPMTLLVQLVRAEDHAGTDSREAASHEKNDNGLDAEKKKKEEEEEKLIKRVAEKIITTEPISPNDRSANSGKIRHLHGWLTKFDWQLNPYFGIDEAELYKSLAEPVDRALKRLQCWGKLEDLHIHRELREVSDTQDTEQSENGAKLRIAVTLTYSDKNGGEDKCNPKTADFTVPCQYIYGRLTDSDLPGRACRYAMFVKWFHKYIIEDDGNKQKNEDGAAATVTGGIEWKDISGESFDGQRSELLPVTSHFLNELNGANPEDALAYFEQKKDEKTSGVTLGGITIPSEIATGFAPVLILVALVYLLGQVRQLERLDNMLRSNVTRNEETIKDADDNWVSEWQGVDDAPWIGLHKNNVSKWLTWITVVIFPVVTIVWLGYSRDIFRWSWDWSAWGLVLVVIAIAALRCGVSIERSLRTTLHEHSEKNKKHA